MQYMILCAERAQDFAKRNDPAEAQAYWGSWAAYSQALVQAGVFVSGAGLMAPSDAATVRLRDGARDVQDGPYADAKEQLGGFFIIEVATIEDALAWAARSPSAAYASAEVRPVLPMQG